MAPNQPPKQQAGRNMQSTSQQRAASPEIGQRPVPQPVPPRQQSTGTATSTPPRSANTSTVTNAPAEARPAIDIPDHDEAMARYAAIGLPPSAAWELEKGAAPFRTPRGLHIWQSGDELLAIRQALVKGNPTLTADQRQRAWDLFCERTKVARANVDWAITVRQQFEQADAQSLDNMTWITLKADPERGVILGHQLIIERQAGKPLPAKADIEARLTKIKVPAADAPAMGGAKTSATRPTSASGKPAKVRPAPMQDAVVSMPVPAQAVATAAELLPPFGDDDGAAPTVPPEDGDASDVDDVPFAIPPGATANTASPVAQPEVAVPPPTLDPAPVPAPTAAAAAPAVAAAPKQRPAQAATPKRGGGAKAAGTTKPTATAAPLPTGMTTATAAQLVHTYLATLRDVAHDLYPVDPAADPVPVNTEAIDVAARMFLQGPVLSKQLALFGGTATAMSPVQSVAPTVTATPPATADAAADSDDTVADESADEDTEDAA